MVVDDVRTRLRRKLEDSFGAEEASYLMDRPLGGWNDLVTVGVLDARLASLGDEVRAEIHEVRAELQRELRAQTWRLATLVVAAQAVVVAALGGIGAVLRFA
jgi:DnaJ-domain-containing protein 1